MNANKSQCVLSIQIDNRKDDGDSLSDVDFKYLSVSIDQENVTISDIKSKLSREHQVQLDLFDFYFFEGEKQTEKKIENQENLLRNFIGKNLRNSDKLILKRKPQSSFDCPICLEKNLSFEKSFQLGLCAHTFCKKCLNDYINKSECGFETIECPCKCTSLITDDEIERILDPDSYEKFKLRRAESKELCLNDHSKDPLIELIDQGLVMRCPKCGVPIEKKDAGCQFVRCFYCKLDICYLTKQARWGPMGKGDVSGGCKCGVDGKKCHPDCNNCH